MYCSIYASQCVAQREHWNSVFATNMTGGDRGFSVLQTKDIRNIVLASKLRSSSMIAQRQIGAVSEYCDMVGWHLDLLPA